MIRRLAAFAAVLWLALATACWAGNPTLVAGTVNQNSFTTGTSVTVVGGGTVTAGNLMVVSLSLKGASRPTGLTPPAGWSTYLATTAFSGNNGSFAIFYLIKAATGTFSGSFTWTNSATAGSWTFSEWTGVNQSTPTDATATTSATSGSTTVTIPSITPTAGASDTWLGFGFVFGAPTVTGFPSAGFSSVIQATGTFDSVVESKALASSGATGTASFTLGTSSPNTGVSMLLQPPAAGGAACPSLALMGVGC